MDVKNIAKPSRPPRTRAPLAQARRDLNWLRRVRAKHGDEARISQERVDEQVALVERLEAEAQGRNHPRSPARMVAVLASTAPVNPPGGRSVDQLRRDPAVRAELERRHVDPENAAGWFVREAAQQVCS